MSEADNNDYCEVGRGKPPRTAQFKRGHSGNPKGRPIGSKNMSTVLYTEMDARIPVTEGGKRKKITKREAVAKRLVNKAVEGDLKATAALLAEERHSHGSRSAEPRDDALLTPKDTKTVENVIKRIRAGFLEEMSAASGGESNSRSEPGAQASTVPGPTSTRSEADDANN